MGRRLRHFEPDGIYFLTNRCAKGRYLLTPGPELNDAVETLMARYSTCLDIELLGWIFMGNHFHLIVRSENRRIPDFMRDFQSELSVRVQTIRDGWDESVFPKRYDAEPILDDEKLREKLLYVWMNPVRAGLVRHPDDWPGVSSADLHRDGEPRERSYLDRTKLRRLRRRADDPDEVDPEKAMRTYQLEVTNPPFLADRSVAEAGAELREDLEALCRHWTHTAELDKDGVAGADRVRNQNPLDHPEEPPEGPEPLCLTSCEEKRKAYRNGYSNIVHQYEQAMEKWRAVDLDCSFPPGTYPPGWMRAARKGEFADSDASNNGDDEYDAEGGSSSGGDNPRGDPDETKAAA